MDIYNYLVLITYHQIENQKLIIMFKSANFIVMLLLGLFILSFSGCGNKQQKEKEEDANAISTEAMAEFQMEKKVLLEKANMELSAINKKILACNDKIKHGAKLTDAQNKALDDFEEKRASINKRIHELKNVSYENWTTFKATFETDLESVSSDIERILTEL